MTNNGLNYGFVEYFEVSAAELAMATLNGRKIFSSEVRVNWAYAGNNSHKEDTTSRAFNFICLDHFHIFVGDLAAEINDEMLMKAFSSFPSVDVSDSFPMWYFSIRMSSNRTKC